MVAKVEKVAKVENNKCSFAYYTESANKKIRSKVF